MSPVPLAALLAGVEVLETRGNPAATPVAAVVHDTAAVVPGALYCCLPGRRVDGHDLAPAAVAAGARALLVERLVLAPAAQVRVADARAAMAPVAAAFFGHPSKALAVVGVTGTNGKTTTVHLLAAVLEAHGRPTGVLGTLAGRRTTPEAPELQAALARFSAEGKSAAAMEVSSHALDAHRVDATSFSVAVFTNLGPEHLDHHGTMEAYFAAKARLFEPERAAAGVANADDPYGRRLLALSSVRRPVRGFALADAADLVVGRRGSRFVLDGHRVHLRLAGRFNVSNALAAAAAARTLGVPAATVAEGLGALASVPGRFEAVDAGQPFVAVVDYAHTPDALDAVLSAAREVASYGPGGRPGRVLVVFGAGGDRDRAKRPAMGAVATERADLAVLTSDNPRSEDPLAIIAEVRAGVRRTERLVVEPDREEAIRLAAASARPGDVVVVAGKGHETGQEANGIVVPFDDREVLRRVLAGTAS